MIRMPSKPYLIAGIFIVGFCVGFWSSLFNLDRDIVKGISPFREKDNNYEFINPLLFYEIPNGVNLKEFDSLVRNVRGTIDNFVRAGNERKTSFYFRDLNRGQWVGINENERYTPSSLLKVVVMIAYFKEAESRPSIFSNKILFSEEIAGLIGSIPHDKGTELDIGQKYSVSDLIKKMIIQSDNGATYALLSEVNDKLLDQIYSDLELENPGDAGRTYTISPQDFVPFLRILYNATYLNREMSDRALALLSQTNFQDGIAAGIPRSIKIAHKYGETVSGSEENVDFIELHDCGIVYYPDKPYLLCIMSRGEKLEVLSSVMKDISETVYSHVSSSK